MEKVNSRYEFWISSCLINFTSRPLDSPRDELKVQPSIKKPKPAVLSTIEDSFPSRPAPKASAMKPHAASKASSSGGPSRKGKKAVHSIDDGDSLMLDVVPPPAVVQACVSASDASGSVIEESGRPKWQAGHTRCRSSCLSENAQCLPLLIKSRSLVTPQPYK